MNQRRVLDATHLRDIFLWIIRTKGTVREYRPNAEETIIVFSSIDFPSVDIEISSLAIDTLAEQLRVLTAVDVSANAEDFARLLAQIAIVANYAGPKVSGPEINSDAIESFADKICIEFAVVCAVSFADSFNYRIDPAKIPKQETSIALIMNDEDVLAFIFGESLHLIPGSAGPGRHARPEPRNDAEHDAEAFIQYLENQLAGVNPIPNPASRYIDRQPSASNYTKLRFIAALEGWTAEQMLILIDGYLSPYAAQRYAEVLIRYLEDRHPDVNPVLNRVTKDAERQLSAVSHWNLRSIAALEGWYDHQVLLLIDEHLYPALDPELIHHSNTISGLDWRRMYDSMFRRDGDTLWTRKAESSHE